MRGCLPFARPWPGPIPLVYVQCETLPPDWREGAVRVAALRQSMCCPLSTPGVPAGDHSLGCEAAQDPRSQTSPFLIPPPLFLFQPFVLADRRPISLYLTGRDPSDASISSHIESIIPAALPHACSHNI